MRSSGRGFVVGEQTGCAGQHGQSARRPARLLVVCGAILAMLAVSAASQAGGYHRGPYPGHYWGHGGHHWRGSSVSVVVGVPMVGPYLGPGPLYDWPYRWPSRTVIVESPPTVYIERDAMPEPGPADVKSSGDWWYYCRKPQGYYPDVGRCPGGWERVPPRSE